MTTFGSIPSDRYYAGKTIIPTEESRTNTAYGYLTTEDKVAGVILTTDGLIFVAYHAMWKGSAVSPPRALADIFLNGVELKSALAGTAAPISVPLAGPSTADTYAVLSTYPGGLMTTSSATAYTGDVTTGQVLGGLGAVNLPGVLPIFAAAGTYDVGVQFASTPAGTVTAKQRKLWVWTMAF